MENNFKRFLSLVLAFVMVFGMFPANVFATEAETTEAETGAWYDETATELIVDSVDEYVEFVQLTQQGITFAGQTVKLGADLDMSEIYIYYNDGTENVNNRADGFAGTFDGDGHTITNMRYFDSVGSETSHVGMAPFRNLSGDILNLTIDGVEVETTDNVRFYGLVSHTKGTSDTNRSEITNVTIKNLKVAMKNDTETNRICDANGMLGNMQYTDAINCHVENAEFVILGDASYATTGFVYNLASTSTVQDCSVKNLTVQINGSSGYVGGFAGGVGNQSSITNCTVDSFTANIGSVNTDYGVGGFAGTTTGNWGGNSASFTDCHVTNMNLTIGTVNAGLGGFIGSNYGGGVNSFTDCTVSGTITANDGDGSTGVGGFIGNLGGRSNNTVTTKCENCVANVTVSAGTIPAGGFIGTASASADTYKTPVGNFTGCVATGDVSSSVSAGGFAGTAELGTYSECTASGNALCENGYAAGLIGLNLNEDAVVITDCTPTTEYAGLLEDEVYNVPSVAAIDKTGYPTLAEAVAAANNLGTATVTLLADVELSETLVISGDKTVELDLNGHTITVSEEMSATPAFRVLADVTVKGGTVDATAGTSTYAFIVGNNDTTGSLTIESGSYYGDVSVASVTKGQLNVSGGYFEATEYNGAREFTLNCIDANYNDGSAVIVLNGGTYYGYDPENCAAEGVGTDFCAQNYCSIDNGDGTWTVVDYVEWIKAELLAGRSVKLEKDIVVDGSYIDSIPAATNGNGTYFNPGIFNVVGDVDVTFDLNGHNITYVGHADAEYTATLNADKYNGVINSCTVAHGLFFTNAAGKLTIVDSVGTGTVDVHGMASAVYSASPDSVITVEAGNWTNDGCETCGGSNLFLYASHGGELYITGGFFEQKLDSAGDSYLIVENGGEFANSVIDYSLTKIEITGGIFAGMNPEKAVFIDQGNGQVMSETNVVADGYFVIEASDKNNSWIEGNTWTVVDAVTAGYVAYNVQDDLYFGDLSDALDVAEAGETVQLLTTWDEKLVLVPAGVTFDLNGNVVKTDNVLSFGVVMDSKEEVGGIEIDIDTAKAFTKLQPENGGYLPVYDTRDGMYKFFTFDVESNKVTALNAESVVFYNRIVFDNMNAYEVLANTENSGIDFVLTLNWTGMSGFEIRYTMTDDNVRNYAKAAYTQLQDDGENRKAMTATIRGMDKLGEGAWISAAPSVETVAEVTDSAAALTYTNS